MTASAVATDLQKKHCVACEEGIPALSQDQIRGLLTSLPHWKLAGGGKRIRREWRVKDFAGALEFFRKIGDIAEHEDHHPDLHLTGYRNVAVELSTHAVDGLTENDFILAAKIDALPVALKS